jgi:hypothetical protein
MKSRLWPFGGAVVFTSLNHANAALLNVNYAALISRADLDYTNSATRSEEGMPVGNGRMRSLVWATPSAAFSNQSLRRFAEDGSELSRS